MSKELVFTLGGESFAAPPVKLERAKLYGRTETVASDAKGNVCSVASLDANGTLVIPGGAIKNGLLDDSGEWIDRAELVTVDDAGNILPVQPSSFDDAITLDHPVMAEEFLDHQWKSVYQLDLPELAEKIGTKIFEFPFRYRSGVGQDDGFLLASGTHVWLFTGTPLSFSYLGITEEGVFDDTDEMESPMDEELDFDIM